MQSVSKNVAIPATLRVSARQRDDNTSTYFDADIAKTVIGDGIVSIFQQTPRLLLNADAGMEDLMMTLRDARVVMTTEANNALSGASALQLEHLRLPSLPSEPCRHSSPQARYGAPQQHRPAPATVRR